jgi:hypothetical protein
MASLSLALIQQLGTLITHLTDRSDPFRQLLNTQWNADLDAVLEHPFQAWDIQSRDLILSLLVLSARLEGFSNLFGTKISARDTVWSDLRMYIAAWKTTWTALTTKVTALDSDITKELKVQGGESVQNLLF